MAYDINQCKSRDTDFIWIKVILWQTTLWNIQQLSLQAVKHNLNMAPIRQNPRLPSEEKVSRWIFKVCSSKFSICFQLPGHIKVNQWADVQHIKHGVRPFHSHQLTRMCNTVQQAAGYVCLCVWVSVFTASVAPWMNVCVYNPMRDRVAVCLQMLNLCAWVLETCVYVCCISLML